MDNREHIHTCSEQEIPLVERLRYPGWTRDEYFALCLLAADMLEKAGLGVMQEQSGCVACLDVEGCAGYEVHVMTHEET